MVIDLVREYCFVLWESKDYDEREKMPRMITLSFFGRILAQRHWDELKTIKECIQLQQFA